jgi:hypothetical protein
LAELCRDGSDEKRLTNLKPRSGGVFFIPALKKARSCGPSSYLSSVASNVAAFCYGNGRLVGVVAPGQPFAHSQGHKRTKAHCFSAKAK